MATPPKPSPPARSNVNLRLAAAGELGVADASAAMEVAGASAAEVAAAAVLAGGWGKSQPHKERPCKSGREKAEQLRKATRGEEAPIYCRQCHISSDKLLRAWGFLQDGMETCPAEVAVNTRDDMSEVEKIREAEHFAKEVDERLQNLKHLLDEEYQVCMQKMVKECDEISRQTKQETEKKLTAMKQNMEAEYLTVMKTLKEEFEQRPDVEP
eukprot:jgi/Tetstr1/433111/TSEL_022443.t1